MSVIKQLTRKQLEYLGYSYVRQINGKWYGLVRMLFTTGLFCDLDEYGPKGRICFDTYQNAKLFLDEWDGKTSPVVGEDGCTADKRT